MNIDTFYAFEHKYLFVKQLRFKINTFLCVQTYHFLLSLKGAVLIIQEKASVFSYPGKNVISFFAKF